MNTPNFSTLCRRVRKNLALTQVQLALMLGCHAMTVSKWERGIKEPSTWQSAFLWAFDGVKVKNLAYVVQTRGPIYAMRRILMTKQLPTHLLSGQK